MPDNYRFDYAEGTPYANAVQLIARHRRPGGEVVVDLGCGHGAVAEPLAALGLAYLGVDSAPDGLHDLAGRGFPTLRADLADPQAAI